MKILILSTRVPYPLTAGFRIRIYSTAKYLKKAGHSVGLLQMTSTDVPDEYIKALSEVFDDIYTVKMKKSEIAFNLLGNVFNRSLPFQVALYKNKEYRKKLDEIYISYDAVIANNIRSAEYVKKLTGIRKIHDMHDAISYNYQNAVTVTKGIKKLMYSTEYKRLKKYECDILKHFDRSIIISDVDRSFLKSNGADTDGMDIIPVAVRDDIKNIKTNYSKDEKAVCFLGKMSYQPNEDAVLYFAENVFPKLKKDIPELKFYVIGIEPTPAVLALKDVDGIEVTGFVDNPFELVEKCTAMVVPIRNGAGMQNKVLESMVVGTPSVISPIAAEGLDGKDGEHFFVAENPDEYVKYIKMLCKDEVLRKKIGEAGKEHIKNNFSWEILSQKWNKIVTDSE